MTVHFGVLIPSTNTTTEKEYSRLPAVYQAHYARVRTSTPGKPFSPGRDEEVEYQSQLLATAKVQMVTLLQTSASLFADDYDETTMRRMSAMSTAFAPPLEKPVEVLTKSAPALTEILQAASISASLRRAVSRMTFRMAPLR